MTGSCDRSLWMIGRNGTGAYADKPLTNPAELCRTDALLALLRMCGIEERRIGASASDFEFFSALVECRTLLKGHPLAESVFYLLSRLGWMKEEQTDAATLWRAATAGMEWGRFSPARLMAQMGEELLFSFDPAQTPPREGRLFVEGEEIFSNVRPVGECTAWTEWEAAAVSLLASVEERVRGVRIRLPKKFRYLRPNRYEAERYLSGKASDGEAGMRHLAQTVRFFCTWCAPRGISLLLMADEAGEAAAEMLREAEAAVGLPPIVWVAEDEKSRDALLAFSGDGHGAPIARALPLERYPSRPELEAALQSYATRTPIGRLQLCSTLPWYALPYEHARVREALRIFNASAAEE